MSTVDFTQQQSSVVETAAPVCEGPELLGPQSNEAALAEVGIPASEEGFLDSLLWAFDGENSKDEDAPDSSSPFSFGVDGDGVNLGWTTDPTPQGDRTEQFSTDLSLGPNGGALGGGFTTKEGEVEKSIQAKASFQVLDGGYKAGADVGGKVGKLGGSAGASGSFQMGEPVQTEGGWAVDFAGSLEGHGGGSYGDTGLSVGAGGTAGGRRVFENQADAEAFAAGGVTPVLDGSASQVGAMKPGEVFSSVSSVQAGVNGKVQGVAMGVNGAHQRDVSVTKGDGDVVVVEEALTDSAGGAAGLAAPIVGVKGTATGTRTGSVTATFDFSQPGAAEAYEAYLRDGVVPETSPGVSVANAEENKTRTGTEANVAGLQLGSGSTQGKRTEIDAAGRRQDTDFGGTDASGDFFGLWSYSESTNLDAQGGDLTAVSTVDASGAHEAEMGLNGATGAEVTLDDHEKAASGAWTVETVFPEGSADAFIDQAVAGEINPHDFIIDGSGESMVEALRAADGDRAAQQEILAAFAADAGEKAVATLRHAIDGDEQFLTLEGSETFIGKTGHDLTQNTLGGIEELVAVDPAGAHARSQTLELQEMARLRDLQDPTKYRDLPDSLREKELQRIDENLARIEAAKSHAVDLDGSLATDTLEAQELTEGAVDGFLGRTEKLESRRAEHAEFNQFSPLDTQLFGYDWGPEAAAYEDAEARWEDVGAAHRAATTAELEARKLSQQGDAAAAEQAWGTARSLRRDVVRQQAELEQAYGDIEARNGMEDLGYAMDGTDGE